MTREEINKYFAAIGMTAASTAQANLLIDDILQIAPAPIEDVFVSDEITAEGRRSQSSLWVFTSEYFSEAKSFMIQRKFDITGTDAAIFWTEFTAKEYTWGNPTDESRLAVRAQIWPYRMSNNLTAVRNNCDFLLALTRKRLLSLSKSIKG